MPNAKFPVAQSLQPFVDRGQLVGAVTLIADKDNILQVDTVGLADRAKKTPMREDTFFWIASTTKPMTAVALMMLVDEGKVRVEAPVEEYLPDFAGQQLIVEKTDDRVVLGKPAHPITVAEVLSHTSGLPFMSRVEKVIDARPLREAAATYALSPLIFEPGTAYQYSNAGTNTAGRIVEVLSGQPYEQFMQQRLFDPLGMTETTFNPTAGQIARLAKTYKPTPEKTEFVETKLGQFTHPLESVAHFPCPAGGLFSTAKDVAAFGQMLLNRGTRAGRRYLSEESFAKMTTIHTRDYLFKDGVERGYGYGMEIVPSSKGALTGEFGHGGAYGNKLFIDPATGRVMVYMIQHNGWLTEPANEPWTVFRSIVTRK